MARFLFLTLLLALAAGDIIRLPKLTAKQVTQIQCDGLLSLELTFLSPRSNISFYFTQQEECNSMTQIHTILYMSDFSLPRYASQGRLSAEHLVSSNNYCGMFFNSNTKESVVVNYRVNVECTPMSTIQWYAFGISSICVILLIAGCFGIKRYCQKYPDNAIAQKWRSFSGRQQPTQHVLLEMNGVRIVATDSDN